MTESHRGRIFFVTKWTAGGKIGDEQKRWDLHQKSQPDMLNERKINEVANRFRGKYRGEQAAGNAARKTDCCKSSAPRTSQT